MSVDYDNPTFITGGEKAKLGLDMLYTKDMNSSIIHIPEFSSKRIQTVKLSLDIPIILINVYLPASSLSQEEYNEALNLLSATITRYRAEAAILCAGDFNRSLFRNNQGDKKFQSFCQSAWLPQLLEQTKN